MLPLWPTKIGGAFYFLFFPSLPEQIWKKSVKHNKKKSGLIELIVFTIGFNPQDGTQENTMSMVHQECAYVHVRNSLECHLVD